MGKKRAVSVRRIGETLIKLHPKSFTSDFEENKKRISNMTQFPSRSSSMALTKSLTSPSLVLNEEKIPFANLHMPPCSVPIQMMPDRS